MQDKEKIRMLERQVELLEQIIELQKAIPQTVITYPVYPTYPLGPSIPESPWYRDYPTITCVSGNYQ